MAVSIALRGSAGVSPSLRKKIQNVAREMGYSADPVLQRLGTYRGRPSLGQSRTVLGWINHWPNPKKLRSFQEFEQYWRGARFAADRMGFRLEEFIWPKNCSAKEMEQLLLKQSVPGLLIPPHPPEVDWNGFDLSRFSLIRFGLSGCQINSNLVTADHQRAVVMAVKRIQSLGYERIGLVYDAAHDHSMGGNFYGGFLWANQLLQLKQHIPILDFNVQSGKTENASHFACWMKEYSPDAILTTAPQIPAMLSRLGYQIPRDVAVAGTSRFDIPVEAGIDQCSHAVGQIAAEMLIKQISLNERGEPADPCRILVESRWCDGDSLPPKK